MAPGDCTSIFSHCSLCRMTSLVIFCGIAGDRWSGQDSCHSIHYEQVRNQRASSHRQGDDQLFPMQLLQYLQPIWGLKGLNLIYFIESSLCTLSYTRVVDIRPPIDSMADSIATREAWWENYYYASSRCPEDGFIIWGRGRNHTIWNHFVACS